ncbi:MAG TPA: DUF1573 domain-containing protein [Tenuifilaceae bacterium]|nr:DUF1573 domain-containing protein [Tenuifilaceae bacterium]
MKKLLTALFSLAFVTLGYSQSSTDTLSVKKAEIQFAQTEIHYGVIEQYSNGEKSIEFTNTGSAPLVLTNVVPSCGCTVVDWPKEPVSPSEKGKIIVKYNTGNTGTFRKSIRVFSNAKTSPVMLIISGEVKPTESNSSPNQK